MAAWEAANNSGASWGLEALRRTFETPLSLIWVADGEGELRGYLIGLELPDGFELLNLLVPPAARRQGVGSFLLAELLVLAGAATIFLEVRAENEAALALYTLAGFTPTGCRKAYYRDGADALLMSTAK